MTDEVICRIENKVGRITLNRPGALHALRILRGTGTVLSIVRSGTYE